MAIADQSSAPRSLELRLFAPSLPLDVARMLAELAAGSEPTGLTSPTWLIALRRALARRLPAAFDRRVDEPWSRPATMRGSTLSLSLAIPVDVEAFAEVTDAAAELRLALYDATAHELSIVTHADDLATIASAIDTLLTGTASSWVVVEGGPQLAYYVQMLRVDERGVDERGVDERGVDERGGLRLEAVAGRHLPDSLALTAAQTARLELLGLVRSRDPEDPNHALVLTASTRAADGHRAAQLVSRVMCGVYGLGSRDAVRVRVA